MSSEHSAQMKTPGKFSSIPRISAIVLAVAGSIFYLAGQFAGAVLILLAGGLYLAGLRLEQGDGGIREAMARWKKILAAPLSGALIAIVIGGIIMLLTGYNPIKAYSALFYGGLVKNWHISVINAAPLIFTGLSVAFAFKAGLFNIGAEGQYYIGAMAAVWLGLILKLPGIISLILVFAFAAALSAAWNLIPALLKVKTGAHEVITTMMLAHTARYLSPIFIRAFGGNPSTSTHPYVTDEILPNNFLPVFKTLFPNANYRLHTGILISIATAFFIQYLLTKTRTGFEIRAIGQNKEAARAQGISIGLNVFRALLIAGALAGLAGVNQVTGLDHKMFENLHANYGWNGISVALLAGGHPIGVVFTSLIWGILDSGGQYMARTTQTPNAIVEIVKGITLFLVVARYISFYLKRYWKRWNMSGGK